MWISQLPFTQRLAGARSSSSFYIHLSKMQNRLETSPALPFCAKQPWSWQHGVASSLEASPGTCSVSFPFSVRWQAFSSVTFTLTVVLLLLLECFDLSHGRCHKLVFTKLNTRGLSVLAQRQGFRWLRPHWGGSKLIAGARLQKDSRPECHLKQKWN